MHDDDAPLRPSGARPSAAAPTDDDRDLGGLVREIAAGWTAPPQRLGRPTWRDLVARRAGSGVRTGSWLRRLAGATAGAVVATLALALVAVWLTTPRSPAAIGGPGATGAAVATVASGATALGGPTGSGAAPSGPGASTPTVSSGAAAPTSSTTPLPVISTVGGPLPESSVLVGAGSDVRSLSLLSGQLGPSVAARVDGISQVWRQSGGDLCACFSRIDHGNALTIRHLRDDGSVVSETAGPSYTAPANPSPNGTPSVELSVQASRDFARLYVAWSTLNAGSWQTGIDVVDVSTGAVIQRVPGQVVAAADSSGAAIVAWTPLLEFSPNGSHAMVIATTFSDASGLAVQSRSAASVAPDGKLTTDPRATAFGAAALDTSTCNYPFEGFATNAIYYSICRDANSTMHRYGPDGTSLGDLSLGDIAGNNALDAAGGPLIDPDRGLVYLWNVFSHQLTVVNAASGVITATGVARTAPGAGRSALDVLAVTIGRWIAPSAAAKVYLHPSVLLSPDGTRLYALGVTGSGLEDPGGSAGVFVFDLQSLALVGHWPALADWWSLALSRDGTILYAAGMPEANAAGARTDQAASVVGLDAATGAVRVIAGALPSQVDFSLHTP